MDLYFELLKYPIFTLEDVSAFYNNQESARTALKRLLSKGRIMRIRRNLYTAISGETGGPVANRFQIASAITQSVLQWNTMALLIKSFLRFTLDPRRHFKVSNLMVMHITMCILNLQRESKT